MKPVTLAVGLAAGLVAATATPAWAQTNITFTATLNGLQETPPNLGPATGTANLTIDTTTLAFTLSLSFTGLTSPMTMAHIHLAPPGAPGPVIIGLDGLHLPTATPPIPRFVTAFNGTLTGIWPAPYLSALRAGNTYINIHSVFFPEGEIRGQLVPAPTPASLALLVAAGIATARRRR